MAADAYAKTLEPRRGINKVDYKVQPKRQCALAVRPRPPPKCLHCIISRLRLRPSARTDDTMKLKG